MTPRLSQERMDRCAALCRSPPCFWYGPPPPTPAACSSPTTRRVPPAGHAQPQGDHRHRGPGRRHPRRADLPQPHGSAARSHLRLPRAQGRQPQPVHHVGRRQGNQRRAGRGRQGPRDLHQHRPPHPGPRPARIHRQQPGPAQGLPDPGQRRSEGHPQLPQRRRQRERPRRVRLSAQDRRQGRRHAGGVLHHGDHQVAARRRQRLQPHPRHHAEAHQRQRSRPSTSTRTRRCSTRTSSSSTRPATRTSA